MFNRPRFGSLLAENAGCDVILYGRNYVFTVRMEPQKERSSSFGLPLDSQVLPARAVELYVHQFAGNDYVGDILAVILRREGVDVMTLGEYYGKKTPICNHGCSQAEDAVPANGLWRVLHGRTTTGRDFYRRTMLERDSLHQVLR